MNYEQFVGQVQHRARLASAGEAVRAIRATLETLAERITPAEAKDIAAQLPWGLRESLTDAAIEAPDRFSLDEFLQRVAAREETDLPDATYHARVVIEVLQEAVTPGEIEDIRAQLPEDWEPLFTVGSTGDMGRERRRK